MSLFLLSVVTGRPARATSLVATRISLPTRTARISPLAMSLRTVSGEQVSASATCGMVRYVVIGVVSAIACSFRYLHMRVAFMNSADRYRSRRRSTAIRSPWVPRPANLGA